MKNLLQKEKCPWVYIMFGFVPLKNPLNVILGNDEKKLFVQITQNLI